MTIVRDDGVIEPTTGWLRRNVHNTGSGNTWTRLLIDYSTGLYSGSIYDDASVLAALPGEAHCNLSVSAVKPPPVYEPEVLLFLDWLSKHHAAASS